MEEVAEGIYRVEVRMPKVDVIFATYLIPGTQGVIVEPGPAAATSSIQEAMQQLGMEEVAYIIPTHIHLDHAGASGSLTRLFPQARVVVHPRAVSHAVNPSRLIESTRMSFGNDFESTFGHTLPIPESQIIAPQDGETVSPNGRRLQFIYSPGHANHHIAILDEKTQGLFCGEALGIPLRWAKSSPVPIAAPPSFDMDAYLETMEKLREFSLRLLFYSHDGTGDHPDELIPTAAENTRVFGSIILQALRKGGKSKAITRRIKAYLSRHLGASGEGVDIDMSVEGFIFYFTKNGMV